MTNRRKGWIIALIGALGILMAQTATAQIAPERLAAVKAGLQRVKAFSQRLPERSRQRLSSGARNLINLAERWDQIEPRLRRASPQLGGRGALPHDSSVQALKAQILVPKQVSDPITDVAFSSLGGFTQSETSTAWCGNTVVVGFNDSGSFFETFFFPGGLSFNGVARSTNKGALFTDLGFLNPGPVVITDFLSGDPVLACSDANTFYYASLFERATTSDISVSKSTDGGLTFGNPISAVSKDMTTHFLDKPWIAVDPTNPNRLFVTYTDIDSSGAVCGFLAGKPILRTAIELVTSTDGGISWGALVVIDEVCGDPFVQGSQVVVGPAGEVYVAWESFAADFVTREIDISRSTDHGATFGAPVKVDDVSCVGDCSRLQGNFRSLELPTLAVDRSGRATNGNVYLAWNDGRNLIVPDALAGTYGYADVLFSRSSDAGATWSAPVRVNNNPDPVPPGFGTDQYEPGIAVDKTGRVGACFYDRRRDPNDFLIDRECAFSTNGGTSWINRRITQKSFPAVPGQDLLLVPDYMGDYDSLVSDFTGLNSGFLGAWGDNSRGNPDVKAAKF